MYSLLHALSLLGVIIARHYQLIILRIIDLKLLKQNITYYNNKIKPKKKKKKNTKVT